MRILLVYLGLPYPLEEGYHLRMIHLFRRLGRSHRTVLLGLLRSEGEMALREPLASEGLFHRIETERLPSRAALPRLLSLLGLGGEPLDALRRQYPGVDEQLRARVQAVCEEEQIDVIMVADQYAQGLMAAALARPALADICDSRTLFFRRMLDQPRLTWRERLRFRQLAKRFCSLEREILGRFDRAVVVSQADRETLEGLGAQCDVRVVANGVDTERFAPHREVEERPEEVLFFGNMDFPPNVDAARHFAVDILPALRAEVPGATFTIAGTDPVPEVVALARIPGVEVTGRVPDMRHHIARAALLAAPLRIGGGIKNKVLETLAVGKPVVTTALGVEALSPEVRVAIRTAEGAENFAATVAQLLTDPSERRRLGELGRRAMVEHHSWDTAAQHYEEILSSLVESQGRA